MTTTQIEPLDLRKPPAKFLFQMNECVLESLSAALTMTMTMETFHSCRKRIGQLASKYTETASWSTGIIELGLYLTIFGIDTKAHTYAMILIAKDLRSETLILRK